MILDELLPSDLISEVRFRDRGAALFFVSALLIDNRPVAIRPRPVEETVSVYFVEDPGIRSVLETSIPYDTWYDVTPGA